MRQGGLRFIEATKLRWTTTTDRINLFVRGLVSSWVVDVKKSVLLSSFNTCFFSCFPLQSSLVWLYFQWTMQFWSGELTIYSEGWLWRQKSHEIRRRRIRRRKKTNHTYIVVVFKKCIIVIQCFGQLKTMIHNDSTFIY